MHRSTPLQTVNRAYTAGGANVRLVKVDDTKEVQEITVTGMKNERRTGVIAPQNYGFTSVSMPGEDSQGQGGGQSGGQTGGQAGGQTGQSAEAGGQLGASAEGYGNFIGGNRSFMVAPTMDDRRHRLHHLEDGDVAMYRTKDDSQQFHLTKDGGFWSAPEDKKVRMQLVKKEDQQQQQQPAQQPAQAGSSGQQGQQGQQQQKQQKGQKAVYKKDSAKYHEISQEATESVNKEHRMMLDDKDTAVQLKDKKAYVGGLKDKAKFARIITESGISFNAYARINPPSSAVVVTDEGPSPTALALRDAANQLRTADPNDLAKLRNGVLALMDYLGFRHG